MKEPLRAGLRLLLALFMVMAGANHFIDPGFYRPMMPPWLPWHEAMIAISGVAEILGGLGLLHPATRRAAAWGLVALLVAVFPANLHMALENVPLNGQPVPPAMLWGRLPLQLVLIAWVVWTGALRPRSSPPPDQHATNQTTTH